MAEDPFAAGAQLLAQIATRSPDAVAAAKRVFDQTWFADEGYVFGRERVEQAALLRAPNTAIAQRVAAGETLAYHPRQS